MRQFLSARRSKSQRTLQSSDPSSIGPPSGEDDSCRTLNWERPNLMMSSLDSLCSEVARMSLPRISCQHL